MADVAGAYFRGQAAAQAETEHEQQLEDSKLRQKVLKHQIDSLKIEDELRARTVATNNLQLLHGQPEADLPMENVTRTQGNLPSTSVAGGMTGPLPGAATSPAVPAAGAAGAPVSTVAAPGAQDTTTGTNDVTTRRPQAVQIPGIPSLGVPGTSVRPQSLEDMIRARIAEQMSTPYTLAPGARRMIGSDVIGTGGDQFHSIGAGGLAKTDAAGNTEVVAGGRAPTVTRPVAGMLNGKRVFATPTADGGFTIGGRPVQGFTPAPPASEGNADFEHNFRQYQSALSVLTKKHADQVRATIERNKTAAPGEEEDLPDFTPPTYDEWLSQKPKGGGGGGGKRSIATSSDGLTVTVDGKAYKFPDAQKAKAFAAEVGSQ